MKVLFFWLTMGAYHQARMLAISRLKDVDLRVIELTNKDDHFWKLPTLERINVTTLSTKLLTNSLIRSSTPSILNTISAYSPDIIVNGAGYAHPLFQVGFHHTCKKAKRVVWSESTSWDNPQHWLKDRIKSWIVRKYDAGLVAGKNHHTYLTELGMEKKVIYEVGNVVDNDFFSSPSNEKGILYVGRLLKIKNIQFLLEAYNQAVKSGISRTLSIVGDGEERELIESFIVKNSLQDHVFLLGNKQPQEVKEIYAKNDIFVLPSISEPWGLVLNEAMAAGLTILASKNCGAVGELVIPNESGLVFSPFEVEELKHGLMLLDKNETERLRLRKNALNHVREFSPDRYAQKCYSAFQNILYS